MDYINANFIDGYQKSRAFIGTQGPLPDTFDCFWRMIWEQRVSIIIMITNLVERGRRKCDMYWPKDGVETYGVIQVKLVEEEVMAMYTVRTLQIKHLKVTVVNELPGSMKVIQIYSISIYSSRKRNSATLKKLSINTTTPIGPIMEHLIILCRY